jgi:hypothetical protein
MDGRDLHILLKKCVVDQFGSVYAVFLYTLHFADGVVASVEKDVPRTLLFDGTLCVSWTALWYFLYRIWYYLLFTGSKVKDACKECEP